MKGREGREMVREEGRGRWEGGREREKYGGRKGERGGEGGRGSERWGEIRGDGWREGGIQIPLFCAAGIFTCEVCGLPTCTQCSLYETVVVGLDGATANGTLTLPHKLLL